MTKDKELDLSDLERYIPIIPARGRKALLDNELRLEFANLALKIYKRGYANGSWNKKEHSK